MEKGNAMVLFSFNAKEVRVVFDANGEPWWIAKDVCDILGYEDAKVAVRKLDDDEKLRGKIYSSGQMREMTIINESGLYALILRSNKPEAKRFKKWVTAEVLPSIRKNGSYTLKQPLSNYQVAGYKSQLAQKNKQIRELQAKLKAVKNSTVEHTTKKVMEFIDKGLQYDELEEKCKSLEMQLVMFKVSGNETLNKIKYLHEQMSASIPYLEAVLNNGMQRDKRLGWKPRE